jgi:hypothetical protein
MVESGFRDVQTERPQHACFLAHPEGKASRQVRHGKQALTVSLVEGRGKGMRMCLHPGAWCMRSPEGKPSARCTGGGEVTTWPEEHVRLTYSHLDRDTVPLALMPLPLGLSAPRGAVLVTAAAFAMAPPSPDMYVLLPKHNRSQ